MADNSKTVDYLTSKIHLAGSIRLFLVVFFFGLIWIFRDKSWPILILIFISIAVLFTLLMVLHNKLSYRKDYAETLSLLCKHELDSINGDFSAFEGGTDISYAEHPFAEDLDLFGEHSIFQNINRTVTPNGYQFLTNWLLNPLTDKNKILNRQESIHELSKKPEFRQSFYVIGKLQSQYAKVNSLKIELKEYPLSENLFWKITQILIPTIWLIILLGNSYLPSSTAAIYLIFCLFFSNIKNKWISQLHNVMGKADKDLATYSKLMQKIEAEQFSTETLSSLHENFTKKNASKELKRLSQLIGSLNQRFSLIGIILNILYLRDIRIGIKIEKWIQKNSSNSQQWIDSLGKFDAYISLGTFAFNHPDYIYPEITNTYFTMEGEGLGHPLMSPKTCVTNNININKAPNFMIITGANMAGKSTYLRTIGINHVLSCIGLPVYAKELRIYPSPLVTSLRTRDSLNRNESYFFAELKRLKMIIDRLRKGEKLFIILDEILKGTNSIDKQKGSVALMKQLVNYGSCGIIATHDLILGNLIKDFPTEIKNYRFEATITENELHFSYKMLEGIAQNMNACFLMNKMGIIIEANR